MKRLIIFFLLLITVTACAEAPGSRKGTCEQGLCVKLTANEPFRYNEPISMVVQISSNTDQEINVSLNSPNANLEEAISLDNIKIKKQSSGYLSWDTMNTKANISNKFSFKVRLPQDATYQIFVVVEGKGFKVSDYVQIDYSPKGVTAYYSGMSAPTNSGPVPTAAMTLTKYPSYTPQPSPTLLPPIITNTPVISRTNPAYPPPSGSATTVPQKSGVSATLSTLPAYPNPTR